MVDHQDLDRTSSSLQFEPEFSSRTSSGHPRTDVLASAPRFECTAQMNGTESKIRSQVLRRADRTSLLYQKPFRPQRSAISLGDGIALPHPIGGERGGDCEHPYLGEAHIMQRGEGGAS